MAEASSALELTESDIPGAILHEPLENATVHSLRWWLLCHGIQAPSSWRKAKLIERWEAKLACIVSRILKCPYYIQRVRSAKEAGAKVVDVDGSYLHRKQASSSCTDDPERTPPAPLIGWECVSATNTQNVPKVTHGKGIVFHAMFNALILYHLLVGLLYTYLADCVGRSQRGQAFRSLERGFNHWASGQLSKIEINFRHPHFCHVRCEMTPSMKPGLYHVYMLLGREGEMATILAATCECVAG